MSRSSLRRTGGLLLAVLLLGALPVAAQSTFEIMGPIYVHSVSADGTAAAGLTTSGYEICRWTAADSVVTLGQSALAVLGRSAGTVGISDDGNRIAGTIASLDSTVVTLGRWTKGLGWEETMPPIPADGGVMDGALGSGWGISGDGEAVIGLYWRPGNGYDGSAPSVWTDTDGTVGLVTQGRGGRANTANYDGSVVVGHSNSLQWGIRQPAVWEDGVMTVFADSVGGEMRTVNTDGDIIAGYVYDDPSRLSPAALWFRDETGWTKQELGVLPGTGLDYGTGIPLGIADDASIVVGTNRMSMNSYAGFVWTAEMGMLTASEFFTAFDVPAPDGWEVLEFSDVTPDGSTVVGYGFDASTWGSPILSFAIHLDRRVAGVPAVTARDVTLGPAYPNPFNPSTSFRIDLEQGGPLRLEIYDARGRLVRTVGDGEVAAGEHVLRWDGRDDGGRQVASGLYLARARTRSGVTPARRMMLVK